MTRYAILAAALLIATSAAAQPSKPFQCFGVVLTYRNPPAPEERMATMDMQSRWRIPSWSRLQQVTNEMEEAGIEAGCIWSELLRHRGRIPETDSPDESCARMDEMQAILDRDPVVRACTPRPANACEPNKVCS